MNATGYHETIYSDYDGDDEEPWFGFKTIRAVQSIGDSISFYGFFGHPIGSSGTTILGKKNDWSPRADRGYDQRPSIFCEVDAFQMILAIRHTKTFKRSKPN